MNDLKLFSREFTDDDTNAPVMLWYLGCERDAPMFGVWKDRKQAQAALDAVNNVDEDVHFLFACQVDTPEPIEWPVGTPLAAGEKVAVSPKPQEEGGFGIAWKNKDGNIIHKGEAFTPFRHNAPQKQADALNDEYPTLHHWVIAIPCGKETPNELKAQGEGGISTVDGMDIHQHVAIHGIDDDEPTCCCCGPRCKPLSHVYVDDVLVEAMEDIFLGWADEVVCSTCVAAAMGCTEEEALKKVDAVGKAQGEGGS